MSVPKSLDYKDFMSKSTDMKSCENYDSMFSGRSKLTGVKIKNPPSGFNGGETDRGIIDDTHKVIKDEQTKKAYQYELQVNPNCKMYRIGYTREELEKALNV